MEGVHLRIRVILTIFWHITNSEIKLEEAAVLHYTYTKFSDLTSRRDRCGCKPTKEDVKRCFMLDFDRAVSEDAFICNSEAQEIYAVLGASHWMTQLATVPSTTNLNICYAGFYNCIDC